MRIVDDMVGKSPLLCLNGSPWTCPLRRAEREVGYATILQKNTRPSRLMDYPPYDRGIPLGRSQACTFCDRVYRPANQNRSVDSPALDPQRANANALSFGNYEQLPKLYNAHISSGTYSSFVTSLSIRRSDRTCMLWTWNKPERSKASCGYELSAEQIPL